MNLLNTRPMKVALHYFKMYQCPPLDTGEEDGRILEKRMVGYWRRGW